MDKEKLIEFENWVIDTFNAGKLRSPVHLSRGNEDQLIKIFKDINKDDWVFSTYRSHYHALLKGIPEKWLKEWILDNKSIHVMNKEYKFWTSAIVGGTLPVALGTAIAIKNHSAKRDDTEEDSRLAPPHVWCFVGDMTGRTGGFWECINYAKNHNLPITFVIEDNGLSTDTITEEVWNGTNESFYAEMLMRFPSHLRYYKYERVLPHYGTGKFISSIWDDIKKDDVKNKGF